MAAGQFIDFGSPWKYLLVAVGGTDDTYADPAYDDTGWPTGPAPFGARDVTGRPGADDWLPIATGLAFGNDVWVRAEIDGAVSATIKIDFDAAIYWNGVLLTVVNGPSTDTGPVVEWTQNLPHEDGVLAVWFIQNTRGGFDGSYGDLSARGGSVPVRQYPRDDGRGLSSAPRLFPPPKGQRLVGGYQ